MKKLFNAILAILIITTLMMPNIPYTHAEEILERTNNAEYEQNQYGLDESDDGSILDKPEEDGPSAATEDPDKETDESFENTESSDENDKCYTTFYISYRRQYHDIIKFLSDFLYHIYRVR